MTFQRRSSEKRKRHQMRRNHADEKERRRSRSCRNWAFLGGCLLQNSGSMYVTMGSGLKSRGRSGGWCWLSVECQGAGRDAGTKLRLAAGPPSWTGRRQRARRRKKSHDARCRVYIQYIQVDSADRGGRLSFLPLVPLPLPLPPSPAPSPFTDNLGNQLAVGSREGRKSGSLGGVALPSGRRYSAR